MMIGLTRWLRRPPCSYHSCDGVPEGVEQRLVHPEVGREDEGDEPLAHSGTRVALRARVGGSLLTPLLGWLRYAPRGGGVPMPRR